MVLGLLSNFRLWRFWGFCVFAEIGQSHPAFFGFEKRYLKWVGTSDLKFFAHFISSAKFRDMAEARDAVFNFDKRAVFIESQNFSLNDISFVVFLRNTRPWIGL